MAALHVQAALYVIWSKYLHKNIMPQTVIEPSPDEVFIHVYKDLALPRGLDLIVKNELYII